MDIKYIFISKSSKTEKFNKFTKVFLRIIFNAYVCFIVTSEYLPIDTKKVIFKKYLFIGVA